MPRNELAERFDQAWIKLTSGESGIPTLDKTGYLHSRAITREDGSDGVIWAVTHDSAYVPGSLRPHVRRIDLLLPNGETTVISDFSIALLPNNQNTLDALDVIDRIHSA